MAVGLTELLCGLARAQGSSARVACRSRSWQSASSPPEAAGVSVAGFVAVSIKPTMVRSANRQSGSDANAVAPIHSRFGHRGNWATAPGHGEADRDHFTGDDRNKPEHGPEA